MARVAHLHLFMHDVLTGPNATAAEVVPGAAAFFEADVDGGAWPGPAPAPLWFGQVVVMDDVVTEGPSPASRQVGRAQGLYVFASMGEPAVFVSMNVALTAGPYSGRTVTITGRDRITRPRRELSVVGGEGRFRMATGYVVWRTARWQFGKDAVLELDVFVHMPNRT